MTLEQYVQNINLAYQRGSATEHTYRGDLKQLIESLATDVIATNEPKRQQCGAPDYIITKKGIPVGFIGAKDIGDKDLAGAKKTANQKQFSHLFNAYTQAINRRHNRTGSLFETTFERKLVTSEKYFQQLIFYIHNNPVHHGFVKQMSLYPWTSYETVISDKPTRLKRKEIIELYGDIENFIFYHNQQQNLSEINDFIIEH